MSPRFRHCLSTISLPDPCSHPFSGFMAPLWILGLSLSSPVSVICYVSRLHHLSRRNLVFSASPFIPISAFLSSLSISGVLAAQPASSFLASVHSTVILLFVPSFHLD